MKPSLRPAEWISALVGLAFAGVAYAQNRDVAAAAAAILAFVPAIVTTLATRFPKLRRFRPAEVATGVAGLTAAVVLYAGNRDLGALAAAIQSVVPAIVTGFVVATTPAPPPAPEAPADVELGEVDVESDL